jgi:carboxypeptidase Taq
MMDNKLEDLKKRLQEITDIFLASAVLGWDQQVYMPPGGAESRGNSLATLGKLGHIKATSDELGKLLEELAPYAETLDPDSDDARLIKVATRDYKKSTKVTTEWVGAFAEASTIGEVKWEEAKEKADFKIFQPHLEKIVELRRQYSDFFKPYDHLYDPLLDDFEPGMKTAEVQAIFNRLRPKQVELVKAIGKKPQVKDDFLHLDYPIEAQREFGVEVATKMGFDWKRGRQDTSVHPFTTAFGIGDVRTTTHFHVDQMASAIFSTIHETGHALYEQGISPRLARTPLSNGASMAVHESQSRMWENIVGRSLPFWEYFYPSLQKRFSSQLGNVDLKTFYRAINKVEPSFIRTESDEATYNLHIMLRMELEIALIDGSLQVKDLPAAWNDRMRDYLGITPPNDRLGVLQDVHWSGGMIGYFPTYALGNLVSAQLWEVIRKAIPDIESQFRQGKFSGLLDWLRSNVHQHGAKFEPQELVKRVTGSTIDPQPYLHYLEAKYGEVYGL